MDNPHTTEKDLAYLAAIIDGEGTVTLERTGKRRMSGVMGLSPKVIVVNSNEAIVQHVTNLFTKLGVKPHIKSQDRHPHRKMYWVTVQGLSKCKKILSQLMPYLVGKIAQAQLLLEFIAYRGDSQMAKGKPYGPVEQGILERIRALNFRGVSETEDHGLRSQMTVRTPAKAGDDYEFNSIYS